LERAAKIMRGVFLKTNLKTNKSLICVGLLAFLATIQVPAIAQWQSRSQNIRARISGGGGSGKCTFEVEVDGSAEIQIRGDEGMLRTISGRPAQWRRLDCNQALPRNPNNFRFSGVDGRGQQTLVQDPNRNNGAAVIRIDDNRNGSEGYTGDITWDNGSSGNDRGNGNWDHVWDNDRRDHGWDNDHSDHGWNNDHWDSQSQRIRAHISGNNGGGGKCTFEVDVDGSAEVQIRGDQGMLRTVSGRPAQWRRLDCNQALPRNPGNFRFSGVDGRGRQNLVQDPNHSNGVAVIRIDDPRNGSEGYTGDITWDAGGGNGYWGGGWNNNWDAQSQRIRANVSGGDGSGKCTFEVEVDGSAEIRIRGDQGILRTLSGSPARWRRLDCNQGLPRNPYNFRFSGVDGRGRQSLVQDPSSNNGVTVIRIDDPENGSEAYTGDITWNGGR
jgi:hypothetical protein